VQEHRKQLHLFEQVTPQAPPGTPLRMNGQNISILLLSLNPTLARNNYTLPAFAGVKPTKTVGTHPTQGTTGRITIIGSKSQQQILDMASFLDTRHISVLFTYGRRGTVKAATTAQSQGEASRSLDSPLYIVPPAPVCDDTPTFEEVLQWKRKASEPPFFRTHCAHFVANKSKPGST
jgi:hypothetical protein